MSDPSPEMREVHCGRCGDILHKGPEDYTVLHVDPCLNCINELRDSRVRDAVSAWAKYADHYENCRIQMERGHLCTCGLTALREKFGVKE